MSTERVQPGDFLVVSSQSQVGFLIDALETLSGGGFAQFSHAAIASRWVDGKLMIVEAMPRGAVETEFHYQHTPHLWSTGLVRTSPAAGAAALNYVGWGYNWLDYAAIAANVWHLPFAPDIYARAMKLKQVICSVLVDKAQNDVGCQLFNDDRPVGLVRPADLAKLCLGEQP